MPKLVRLYIVNIAIGFLLAVIFTTALISLNIANLRHLVTSVSAGWVAVAMLVAFHTVLFAGVQFAIAVMRMAEDPGRPRFWPTHSGVSQGSAAAGRLDRAHQQRQPGDLTAVMLSKDGLGPEFRPFPVAFMQREDHALGLSVTVP